MPNGLGLAPWSLSPSGAPFERVIEALKNHNCHPKIQGVHARALCPTHADRRPSLGITDFGEQVKLHCFAGCRTTRVLAALGLRWADLFTHPRTTWRDRPKPVIEAVYEYWDLSDKVVFEKVRYRPKRFRMRVPDPRAKGGYRWQLNGVERILYRWPELIERRRIFVAEGEKAVDCLWSYGLPATCGPTGAGAWLPSFSEALWCAGCVEIIVLPDHDGPGRRFAKAVANACRGYRPDVSVFSDPKQPLTDADLADSLFSQLTVKVVDLPGLRLHEDVVDWFTRGGTRETLLALIESTAEWSPEAEERARSERARTQNAERQRRWRAKHEKLSP